MNQGKLEVVKQEMARVNVDILEESVNWNGLEFNSGDHYIYYCGQESLRRNGVSLRVNKRVWNAVIRCRLKSDRMILVCFQGKSFNITVIQFYVPTTDAKEAEVDASGKEPACQCKRHKRLGFDPWIKKIPWRRKWQPTPVFLPGKSHGQWSLAGYSPCGCKELDMTEVT